MRGVLLIQGVYYAMTALWALLSLKSFERVTGPKIDKWLVKTVGALILCIAAALLTGTRLAVPAPEALVLAFCSAGALAAVDLVYGLRGIISPIYLLDAVLELAFLSSYFLLI